MTYYFDKRGNEMGAVIIKHSIDGVIPSTAVSAFMRNMEEIEHGLVTDVSIASTFKGFPPDLVVAIDKTILRYSSAMQPVNSKQGPDYVDHHAYVRGMERLCSELHTLFHELVGRKVRGFSDDPLVHLRSLYATAEARREVLIEEGQKKLHVLFNNKPLCGFSKKAPDKWPLGHYAVSVFDYDHPIWEKKLCAKCKEIAPTKITKVI